MRIVALLVFRDEEPFLPYVLASLGSLVDGVVAVDDRSTDGGPDLLRAAGATVVAAPDGSTFGQRRQALLEAGRRAGGTHFVVVDADEVFGATFSRAGRPTVEALQPGQVVALPFRTLWKGTTRYRVGREYDLPLACIFADDGAVSYRDSVIHESRLPEGLDFERRVLPPSEGSMVHLQFAAWERAQVKQAWYRAKEYLDGTSPVRVNARYLLTLDGPLVRSRPLDPSSLAHLPAVAPLRDLGPSWHLGAVLSWFDKFGPAHFEPLQIWHVPALRQAFERAEGRPPRSARLTPSIARLAGDAYGSGRALTRRVAHRLG